MIGSDFGINIIAATIYASYLLLPGYLYCLVSGVRRNRFLLSYGISFSLLVITQILVRSHSSSILQWYVLLHGAIVMLIGTGYLVKFQTSKSRVTGFRWNISITGFLVVLGTYCLYHLIVGPYTEIPSDIYDHLNRVMRMSESVCDGNIAQIDDTLAVILSGFSRIALFVLPFLHASVACALKVHPITLLPGTTLVSSLIFVSATYWFSMRLVASARMTMSFKVMASVLSVLFTVLWFGVATFSYIRYYAYFPSIYNFVLLFCVVCLLLDYLERSRTGHLNLILIAIFLLVMRLVHEQEMFFALVLCCGIPVFRSIKTFKSNFGSNATLGLRSRLLALVVITISIALSIFVLETRGMVIGSDQYPHVVSLEVISPLLRSLLIANPELRFWDTLSLYGVCVYLLYIFRHKWFSHIDYLTVAMASPVLTLLNPVFVIVFLHIVTDGGWDVIWRFSYLMPLGITGGFLVAFSAWQFRKTQSFRTLIPMFSIPILLLVLLLPFETPFVSNSKSRFGSLMPVDKTAGAGLWKDLIEAVDAVDGNRAIYADGATRYVLGAVTHHDIPSRQSYDFDHVALEVTVYPSNVELMSKDSGALLVINRRNGSETLSSRLSGHWPIDVLQVSKSYPPELDRFVDIHKERFKLLWSQEKIWLYEIL